MILVLYIWNNSIMKNLVNHSVSIHIPKRKKESMFHKADIEILEIADIGALEKNFL